MAVGSQLTLWIEHFRGNHRIIKPIKLPGTMILQEIICRIFQLQFCLIQNK